MQIPELPQGIPTPNSFFLLSWWRRSKTGKEGRKAKPPLDAAALTEADTLEIEDVRDSRCFGKSFFFMSQGLPILNNRNTLQSLDLGHVKQNNVIQNNGHSE